MAWASDGRAHRREHNLELADLLLRHRSRDRQLTLERLVEHGTRHDADVAEVPFTAFTGRRTAQHPQRPDHLPG